MPTCAQLVVQDCNGSVLEEKKLARLPVSEIVCVRAVCLCVSCACLRALRTGPSPCPPSCSQGCQ